MFFESPRRPKMGPRGLQELSCQILSLRVAFFWAHLGPTLGYLGPSLALRWGSRRASGGRSWAWKACVGGAKWQRAEMYKILKILRKNNGLCRFIGASCLQKGCKLVVWRSCCGLETLPRATWMPSWLQNWLGRAKLSPS